MQNEAVRRGCEGVQGRLLDPVIPTLGRFLHGGRLASPAHTCGERPRTVTVSAGLLGPRCHPGCASVSVGGMSEEARYLVRTDSGDVVVVVTPGVSGLADDLIQLELAAENAAAGFDMVTPLRAFGAKMVDIIELAGTHEFAGSATMREMLVREKATQELKRIELFARRMASDP